VLGLSEALDVGVYGQLTPRQERPIHVIMESGHHLLSLIDDILDLSRIESGHAELDLGLHELEHVCSASISIVGNMARNKGQHISYEITPPSLAVLIDPRRMRQLLMNLLSNAVKFTPENGAIGIRVTGDVPSATVTIVVWDTGIGIKPEDQQRIFDPFVQLDSSLTRQYVGTGLGLALAHKIVALHGGQIDVRSTPGVGSEFVVILPWRTAAPVLDR
jgi:signal transduction histidine kinase